jgi:hypothetical protein|tara:strand:- start:354 stop:548 length:195 start_codon:yes stop_codon:yes gene_type:complete
VTEKLLYVPKVKQIIESTTDKMAQYKKLVDNPLPNEDDFFDEIESELQKVDDHAKASDPKKAVM